ncbi:hypothetical protein R75461_07249 [Paraburkholderia nemoris]|uniref:hypothetical protein n=1 Tax=Paraburkholderia nemoris TaxID=2793076 RepID=UPI00190C1AC7|nr:MULTISPECIES: hypothetical protein [Paraburkholderia]MBK3786094.1 hypothetical protein [Paraburkholderia aspalathi]CAE6846138.1 hypothetical protein R75461_07249 [Paraburkholderia nemoris]
MKNLLALARGLGREVTQRDDMGLFHLLEFAVLVLAVPVIFRNGGDRQQPAGRLGLLAAGRLFYRARDAVCRRARNSTRPHLAGESLRIDP